ncbi:peptidoglycan recognition protein [Nocardioides ferulae]|uniref:peptidoglycan recognition protein family protein n=1 Tax=Nocardioides ferulae TaxID=2340821 RepID=UPI000EAC50AF|nr:peptidoglycan recognition protein [Nocardioides ferulae]
MTSAPRPDDDAALLRRARRRPLLLAASSGAAAVAGLGVAARLGVGADDQPGGHDPQGVLQLSGGGEMGVASLTLPLDDAVLEQVRPGLWQSGRLPTSTHSMVAFTWDAGGAEPRLETSSRIGGAWRSWQAVPRAHEAPEAASGEGATTVGTDLSWVGAADGVRVRVRGSRPPGLSLVLLHPRPLPGDDAETPSAPAARQRAGDPEEGVPAPTLRTRKDWGANESWRDKPTFERTIRQVHVHHTVNSNDYSRRDVPALIRGMYAYHTQSLGWSDLGYNFLVDRFGRVWVGRAGGPHRAVRGAHTLGFNSDSTGVSVIGNFEQVVPNKAILAAVADVAAWKLDKYGRKARGRVAVVSEGSDRFRSGRRVKLPVIDGHRDTNETACPGRHLYDALPKIRRRAARRIERGRQPAASIAKPFAGSGTAVEGSKLRVDAGRWEPADARPRYAWLRDGKEIAGATSAAYLLQPADVGARLAVRVEVAPEGHLPARQTVTFPERVRARTVLRVRATGRRGKATVVVDGDAAGLPGGHLTGAVEISLGGRSRTVQLADGRARAVFKRLEPGSYLARAVFAGSDVAVPGSADDVARVRRVR